MTVNNDARFRKVFSAVLGVAGEDVSDSLTPEDVDTWDSLNHINLMAALEQEFGILFPTEALNHAPSVTHIKSALKERGVAV